MRNLDADVWGMSCWTANRRGVKLVSEGTCRLRRDDGSLQTRGEDRPQHWVLINNVNAARAWFKANGPAKKLPLQLVVRHDFQLLERTIQPTLPGPLPDDHAEWQPAPAPGALEADDVFVKTPDFEGSKKGLGEKKRLRVNDSETHALMRLAGAGAAKA